MVTFCEQNIQNFDPEEFGWKVTDGELKPRWFNGDQFPSSIAGRTQVKQTDGNNSDGETSDPDDGPPKKKPQAQASVIKSKKTKQITRKKNKGHKNKSNDTKDKLLPQNNSGKEADEKPFSATNSSTAACSTISESDWEVSEFLSSDDSCDKWLSFRFYVDFCFLHEIWRNNIYNQRSSSCYHHYSFFY